MTARTTSWGLLSLNQARVVISAAEIKNLTKAPVFLLGNPGPGLASLIISITAISQFGTIPFTNPGVAAAAICYAGPNKLPATSDLTDLGAAITTPQDGNHNIVQVGGGSLGNPSDYQLITEVVNYPIIIMNPFTTGAQDFQAGDGVVNVIILSVNIQM